MRNLYNNFIIHNIQFNARVLIKSLDDSSFIHLLCFALAHSSAVMCSMQINNHRSVFKVI